MTTQKKFDVDGFKYTLAYDSEGIFTKTSIHILSRMIIDNPENGLKFIKAFYTPGPHTEILKDKCGTETTAPAFSACAKLILAKQKICTLGRDDMLIYKYMDEKTNECAVMLFAMAFFEVGISETGTHCEVPY